MCTLDMELGGCSCLLRADPALVLVSKDSGSQSLLSAGMGSSGSHFMTLQKDYFSSSSAIYRALHGWRRENVVMEMV